MLILSLIALVVKCKAVKYVDLICQEVKSSACGALSVEVESGPTFIRKVLHPNRSKVDTDDIVWLRIETKIHSVKFVPAGIKKKFPNLLAIEIKNSGLIHLEREDLRQFGVDLDRAQFEFNLLTALESNLFEFNPSIKCIKFNGNPFKFIDPALIINLKKFKLEFAQFQNSTCIDGAVSSELGNIQSYVWKNINCNDESVRRDHLKKIHERESLFVHLFPEMKIYKLKNDLENFRLNINTITKDWESTTSSLENKQNSQAVAIVLMICLGSIFVFVINTICICFICSKLANYEKILKKKDPKGRGVMFIENTTDNNYYEEVKAGESFDGLNSYEEPLQLVGIKKIRAMSKSTD